MPLRPHVMPSLECCEAVAGLIMWPRGGCCARRVCHTVHPDLPLRSLPACNFLAPQPSCSRVIFIHVQVQGWVVLREGERMHRVLVPTDLSSTSRAVVRYALAVTVTLGGELLLLHVMTGAPLRRYIVRGEPEGFPYWLDAMGPLFRAPCPQEVIYHDRSEEAREKLLSWLPPGCSTRSRALVTVGKVADEIVRVAGEQKADVIVMETPGKRGVRPLLRRTVIEEVIRKVSIPVMTVWGIGALPSLPHGVDECAWMEGLGEPPTGTRARDTQMRSQRTLPVAQ